MEAPLAASVRDHAMERGHSPAIHRLICGPLKAKQDSSSEQVLVEIVETGARICPESLVREEIQAAAPNLSKGARALWLLLLQDRGSAFERLWSQRSIASRPVGPDAALFLLHSGVRLGRARIVRTLLDHPTIGPNERQAAMILAEQRRQGAILGLIRAVQNRRGGPPSPEHRIEIHEDDA